MGERKNSYERDTLFLPPFKIWIIKEKWADVSLS